VKGEKGGGGWCYLDELGIYEALWRRTEAQDFAQVVEDAKRLQHGRSHHVCKGLGLRVLQGHKRADSAGRGEALHRVGGEPEGEREVSNALKCVQRAHRDEMGRPLSS